MAKKRDWKIYKNKTTGMWWTELDGKPIAESPSVEMASYALEQKVKPRLPPYWTIQIYDGRFAWLRLAGRHPHDTTQARAMPVREDHASISALVADAWTAFALDYPEAGEDDTERLPPRTCGYDFFVVEASTRDIEDGWLAEWSNEAGDCHQGVVRRFKAQAINDAWKVARSVRGDHA